MKMDNIQKDINKLCELKNDYLKKIESIEKKIDTLKCNLYEYCCNNNNGHKWIREKESGPYGMTFYYCQICNCERL